MGRSVITQWIKTTGKDIFQIQKTNQEFTIEQVIYANKEDKEMLLLEISDRKHFVPALFIPNDVKKQFKIDSLAHCDGAHMIKEKIVIKETMMAACYRHNTVSPYLIVLKFELIEDAIPNDHDVTCAYYSKHVQAWIQDMTKRVPSANCSISSYFQSQVLPKKLPKFAEIEPMIEYTLSELYQDDLRKSQTKMDVILRKSTKPSSVDHDLPNSQVSATHASSKVMPSSSLPDTSSSNKNSQTVSPLPNTDPQATMLSQQPKSKITLEDLIDSSLGWSVTPNKTQVEDVYAISDTEELEHEEDINALLSHAFYADSEQNKAKDKGKQPERNARSSLKRIETIEFEEPAMKKHRPDNGHQSKPPHVKPTLFQSIRMEQCQPEQSQLQHTQQQPTEQERVQPSRRLKVDSESDASESELLDTLNNKPTLARTQPNVHKSTTPHAPTNDDSDSNASESELLDTLNNKSTLSRIQRKAPNVNKPTTDDSDNNASESDLLNSTLNPSITLLLNNKPTLLPCDQEQVLVKTIHAKDSTTAQKLNALCRFRALYLLQ